MLEALIAEGARPPLKSGGSSDAEAAGGDSPGGDAAGDERDEVAAIDGGDGGPVEAVAEAEAEAGEDGEQGDSEFRDMLQALLHPAGSADSCGEAEPASMPASGWEDIENPEEEGEGEEGLELVASMELDSVCLEAEQDKEEAEQDKEQKPELDQEQLEAPAECGGKLEEEVASMKRLEELSEGVRGDGVDVGQDARQDVDEEWEGTVWTELKDPVEGEATWALEAEEDSTMEPALWEESDYRQFETEAEGSVDAAAAAVEAAFSEA